MKFEIDLSAYWVRQYNLSFTRVADGSVSVVPLGTSWPADVAKSELSLAVGELEASQSYSVSDSLSCIVWQCSDYDSPGYDSAEGASDQLRRHC